MSEWEKLWPAADPPDGFADRVIAAANGRRRRVWPLALAAATVAATAAAVLLIVTDRGVSRGARTPSQRETVALGARGTAVAEAGAELSWLVHDGRAEIEQRGGDVFYRVERGGPFVVHTPAADVRVTGTSFRVEVDDMKKTLLPMAAGAALSATVLVTVYEGKVLLANERGQSSIAAGQEASARKGEPPSEAREASRSPATMQAALAATAPSDDATRKELLARDRAQRSELERLKARVAELESGAGGARGDNRPKPFYDPSPDELKKLADECKLKWDAPSLSQRNTGVEGKTVSELGLSEQERNDIGTVTSDFRNRVVTQLRALYLEMTGDKDGAAELTPDAMVQDLYERTKEDDLKTAFARLSRERAGLTVPPGDAVSAPAIERMQRLLVSLGDNYERELGARIGPDRARQLRELHNGWGNRSSSSFGCPGSN